MPTPTVVHEDEQLQIATWSRLLINRWRTAATVERLDIVFEHTRSLVEATDDGRIAVITTLEDRSGLMPTGAARKRAEQIAQYNRDSQLFHAQIVVGEGFVAATFRALLTGITLAIRAPYPSKVFKSEVAALPWVEVQLRKAGYESDAAQVVEMFSGLSWRP